MDFLKGVYYGVLNLDPTSITFAILLFLIILCMVKTLFTMAITLLLACVFIIGGMDYAPQEIYYQALTNIKEAKAALKATVQPLLEEQLAEAEVKKFNNGSYEIVTKDVKIIGKEGESKITLYFKEEELVVDSKDFGKKVESLLKEAQKDSTAKETTKP